MQSKNINENIPTIYDDLSRVKNQNWIICKKISWSIRIWCLMTTWEKNCFEDVGEHFMHEDVIGIKILQKMTGNDLHSHSFFVFSCYLLLQRCFIYRILVFKRIWEDQLLFLHTFCSCNSFLTFQISFEWLQVWIRESQST